MTLNDPFPFVEIALLAGKLVLVLAIYGFVYLVYRGLIAEAREDRPEETARQARAQAPRMTGPAPFSAEATQGRPVASPRSSALTPPPAIPAPTAPPPVSAAASAASVRSVLAEEPPVEEHHVPALLARELPVEIAEAETTLPPRTGETPAPPGAARYEPAPYSTGETPEQEPGTLVVTPTTPRLVVLRSECVELPPGREFPLLAAATIGRAEHSLVVLPDTFVSSQHALIFLKEGRRVLRDRGSTNGTLVNGHRISGDHILRDGDQITVGTSVLRYVEPE